MKEFVCFSVVIFSSCFTMASGSIQLNCSIIAIIGKYGSSVVLPCWLTPETSAETLEIRWYRPGQFNNPVLFYQNGKIISTVQETFRNRTSLTTMNSQSTGLRQGDISLRLDNVGLSDTGVFHCYVSGDKSYHDNSVTLRITALGSFPRLALEHHRDFVNLSCSSCGWFPRPSLSWKSTDGKDDALFNPQSPIYSEHDDGLFCIYSWVILSTSDSNKISCSVLGSEDEKRIVNMDLGAQLSADTTVVWKILFTLVLLSLLALIGFFLYKKFYSEYKPVSTEVEELEYEADPSGLPMEKLREAAVTITLDMENCMKDYLKVTVKGDLLRDADAAASKYEGQSIPYELCVHGRDEYSTGRVFWEVGLTQENVLPKKSWLIGVAKAPYTRPQKNNDYTPINGFLFLCSDPKKGLFVNTVPEISIPVTTALQRVGVLLDLDKNRLAFYNTVDGVCLCTIRNNFKNNSFVPLFNPGIGDKCPLKIINPCVDNQMEPGENCIAQAGDANQQV